MNTIRLCLVLVIRPEEPHDPADGAVAMKWLEAPWVPYVGTVVEDVHQHKVVGIHWPVDADYITIELEDFVTDSVSFHIKDYINDGWKVEEGL